MSTHGRTRLLAAVLTVGMVSFDAAGADVIATTAVGPGTTSNGGVEVKVESSVPEGELTRGWVEERAKKVLGGLGEPLEEGVLIRVVVGGAPFDYHVSVLLLQGGQALAPEHQLARIACGCGSDEMLDQVGLAIEAGAHTIAEVAKRERDERDERERVEAEARAEEERRRQEEERAALALQQAPYRPTTLGRIGIGVLGVGGAVTLSGIIMAVQDDRVADEQQVEIRTWKAPGYTVLGIGVAAMVGGATVLIIDAVRCRRDKARCVKPTARGPGGAWWATRAAGGAG